ncbi:membrane-bound alpha-1,6- mannosyltransferase Initiation-specific [Nowakowskiella sp. JEL0078]|nr:membrane-bound alpha-1,6- mannosyltransferase Initiation-specific [Nowakowskiella sp. JEL0078]
MILRNFHTTTYPITIESGPSISNYIHQSWVDHSLPGEVSSVMDTWKEKNPKYQHIFYTDTESSAFVENQFPNLFPLYYSLPLNVMRSDLFRYLVVLDKGGVWSDIDTECLRPVDEWTSVFPSVVGNRSVNAIIGVELDASDVSIDWFSVRLQFCQWTFAFAPNHPLLSHVVKYITSRLTETLSETQLRGQRVSVHKTTGPTIWTEAIMDYFKKYGLRSHDFRFLRKPKLVAGDVLVLPITAFSPRSEMAALAGKGLLDPQSFVNHLFLGSWKNSNG